MTACNITWQWETGYEHGQVVEPIAVRARSGEALVPAITAITDLVGAYLGRGHHLGHECGSEISVAVPSHHLCACATAPVLDE